MTGRSNPAAIDPATGAAMSTEPLRFLVEERNQAVWDRHDMAGTIVESVQHWCIEPHGTWAGVGGGSYTSAACNPAWPSGFPDVNVNVVGVGNGGGAGTDAFGTGAPAAVDMGSYAFVYDSQASSASAGPMLFRTRASPGAYLPAPYNQLHGCSPTSSSAPFLPAPYTGCAPQDGYFTNLQSSTATILPSSYDTGAVSGSSATFSGSAANIAISDSYSGSIACSAACNQGTTTSMTVTVTKVFRGVTLILTAPMTYGGAANPEWSTGHRWFAWAPAWGVWFGFEAEGNWQIIAGSPHFIGHVEEYQGINLWFMFWLAGNVNWICLATYPSCGGIDTGGPLPAPDMVVNIVDLAIVASHFGQTPGLGGRYGSQAWDISGSTGAPDGTVNIFDLTRVAIHFGQSFLGGTDIGGGTVGSMPGWMFDGVPNAANPAVSGPYLYPDIGEDCNSLACP